MRFLASVVDGVLEATVVGSFTSLGPRVRSSLDHWQPYAPMPGRTVVITGATSGLGLEIARQLAVLGADLVLVGRNPDKLTHTVAEVQALGAGSIRGEIADLADLDATRALGDRLAADLDHLDVLIHNAGALLEHYAVTAQGYETTFAVHLLSPFLLTELLLAPLEAAHGAKVITMTSGGMYTERYEADQIQMTPSSYKGATAYARAKRAQVVLNANLQQRHGPAQIAFHLAHPGWTDTPGVSASLPTFSKVLGPLLRTTSQGADTVVWLASEPAGTPEGGQLWLDRRPRGLHHLGFTRKSPIVEAQEAAALFDSLTAATAPGARGPG